ncbi:P-loop NTPase family protein [Elioraea thermophila]|uniref:chromosomal replication initiator DnaA n=1 Tax=Elioraea thermophila TaxID=2185104 RepID=UPI000DF2D506|nr:chromosomal replication initiator DnaA [Elioraea thermophila]
MSAEQLALDFPAKPSFAAADFVSAAATEEAERWLACWPDWPAGRLVLVGPEASGKSHLGAIWRARSGAAVVSAAALRLADVPDQLGSAVHVLVENAETAAGEAARERALLHLLNLVAEQGGTVLLTTRLPASRWPLALPDLRSRLVASATATIGAPDQALLAAVLAKQLADRQIVCEPTVVTYLATRLPRDFAAIARVVRWLDALTLAEGRRLGRAQAARVLAALAED